MTSYERIYVSKFQRLNSINLFKLNNKLFSLKIYHNTSYQGAIKHGRGNGNDAPDLCVMRPPPPVGFRILEILFRISTFEKKDTARVKIRNMG
jgi:hypothetical protein